MQKSKPSKKNTESNLSIKVHKGGFVELKDFAQVLDIGNVEYYEIRPRKDGTATIHFYDQNKKLVKPYGY